MQPLGLRGGKTNTLKQQNRSRRPFSFSFFAAWAFSPEPYGTWQMENSKINQMPAIHDFSLEALLNPARIVHNAAWTRHPWQAIDQTDNFCADQL
ncbi:MULTISPECIES: hypothetical protein [Pseudomonas syringae group]|nr:MULTISPECIES: hypothetical protein [Pseudomonas syringae group]